MEHVTLLHDRVFQDSCSPSNTIAGATTVLEPCHGLLVTTVLEPYHIVKTLNSFEDWGTCKWNQKSH